MQELEEDVLWSVSPITVMTTVPSDLHSYELVLYQSKANMHLLYVCGYWIQTQSCVVGSWEQEMVSIPCTYTQRTFSVYVHLHVCSSSYNHAGFPRLFPVMAGSQIVPMCGQWFPERTNVSLWGVRWKLNLSTVMEQASLEKESRLLENRCVHRLMISYYNVKISNCLQRIKEKGKRRERFVISQLTTCRTYLFWVEEKFRKKEMVTF